MKNIRNATNVDLQMLYEDSALELENLGNEIMNEEEEEDIRETENAYLDSLDDSAFDDMDSLINGFLFF